MSKIDQHFENILKAKEVPYERRVLREEVAMYALTFMLAPDHPLVVEVAIRLGTDAYIDAQVIFRNVYVLNDETDHEEALKFVNYLNSMETAYFTAHLTDAGEIFLRNLLRTGEDTHPLYETMVYGTSIARLLSDQFIEKFGESREVSYEEVEEEV